MNSSQPKRRRDMEGDIHQVHDRTVFNTLVSQWRRDPDHNPNHILRLSRAFQQGTLFTLEPQQHCLCIAIRPRGCWTSVFMWVAPTYRHLGLDTTLRRHLGIHVKPQKALTAHDIRRKRQRRNAFHIQQAALLFHRARSAPKPRTPRVVATTTKPCKHIQTWTKSLKQVVTRYPIRPDDTTDTQLDDLLKTFKPQGRHASSHASTWKEAETALTTLLGILRVQWDTYSRAHPEKVSAFLTRINTAGRIRNELDAYLRGRFDGGFGTVRF